MGLIQEANRILQKKNFPKEWIKTEEQPVLEHTEELPSYDFFLQEIKAFFTRLKLEKAILIALCNETFYPFYTKGLDITTTRRFIISNQDFEKNESLFSEQVQYLEKKDLLSLQTFFSSREWNSLEGMFIKNIINNYCYLFIIDSKLNLKQNTSNIFFDSNIIKNFIYILNNNKELIELLIKPTIFSQSKNKLEEKIHNIINIEKHFTYICFDFQNLFNTTNNFYTDFNEQSLCNGLLNLIIKTIGHSCIYNIVEHNKLYIVLFTNQEINNKIYILSLKNSINQFFGNKRVSNIVISVLTKDESRNTNMLHFLLGD